MAQMRAILAPIQQQKVVHEEKIDLLDPEMSDSEPETDDDENTIYLPERMQALGYDADSEGVCFGQAAMIVHAVLNEETEWFKYRIDVFRDIPLKEFAKAVLKVEEKAVARQSKAIQWGKREEVLLETRAYFDGIYFNQEVGNDEELSSFFSKPLVPMVQDILKTLPKMMSQKLKEQGGIECAFEFSGIYKNIIALQDLFKSMSPILRKLHCPVALLIESDDHANAVGWLKEGGWFFASSATAEKATDDHDLASSVGIEFENDEVLSVKVLCRGCDLLKVRAIFQIWSQMEAVKKLHQVTREKASFVSTTSKRTWLQAACEIGDFITASELLEAGANPNFVDSTRGWGPLHFAAYRGDLRLIWLLIQKSALANLQTKFSKQSALYIAARLGHVDACSTLVIFSDINQLNDDGLTALHTTAAFCHHKVTAVLLKAGANPWRQCDEGKIPYFYAKKNKDQLQMQMLKEAMNAKKAEEKEFKMEDAAFKKRDESPTIVTEEDRTISPRFFGEKGKAEAPLPESEQPLQKRVKLTPPGQL